MNLWKPKATLSPYMHALTDGNSSTCLTVNATDIDSQSLLLFNSSYTEFSSIEFIIKGNGWFEEMYECTRPMPMFLAGFDVDNMGEGQCQPFCGKMAQCGKFDIEMPSYLTDTFHITCDCPFGICNEIAIYIPQDIIDKSSVVFCSTMIVSLK